MFKNEMPISRKCLKEGLPKGMYWLGTMVTGNHLLEQLCPQVFRHFTLSPECAERMNPQAPVLATGVSDGAFVASVNAVAQKYLYGQAVLAVSVEEKVWLGRRADPEEMSEQTRLLVRVLRATPNSSITLSTITSLDLRLKRALRSHPDSVEHQEAMKTAQRVFTDLEEMGFGTLSTTEDGGWVLRKFDISSIGSSQWKFLQYNRIPAWLFGESVNGHPSTSRAAPLQESRAGATGDTQANGGTRSTAPPAKTESGASGVAAAETRGVHRQGASRTPRRGEADTSGKPTPPPAGAPMAFKETGECAAAAPEAQRRSSMPRMVPGEASTPALPPPSVPSGPPVLKMVEGYPRVLLPRDRPATTKEARDRVYGAMQVLGATAVVTDVKPIDTSRCFRVKATCRGTRDAACPVIWNVERFAYTASPCTVFEYPNGRDESGGRADPNGRVGRAGH